MSVAAGLIERLDEQTGCLEVLLVLVKENEPLSKRELVIRVKRSQSATYNALKTLKDLGLLTEVEKIAFPYRKDVSITEKGRRVAEHLVEVEKILSEKEAERVTYLTDQPLDSYLTIGLSDYLGNSQYDDAENPFPCQPRI